MLETERRAVEKLQRELGSQLLEFLNSADVIEIVLNADGGLWVERLGEPMVLAGAMTASNAEAIITTVAAMLRAYPGNNTVE
jgi:type IV secretion system protein TrbB